MEIDHKKIERQAKVHGETERLSARRAKDLAYIV